MATETGIAWTNSTLNPVIGCQRVSPGCERCYAEVQDARKRWGGEAHWGPKAPRYRTSRSTWNNALRWNKAAAALKRRHLVFCASLSDVFEDHPTWSEARPDLFALICATPALTWQILTKRPENIARLWPKEIPASFTIGEGASKERIECPPPGEAWPHVWLGTTVEDQQRAEERLPHLLSIPAAVRFVSAEPLLEHVDLTPWLAPQSLGRSNIDWVIAGGESGSGARNFDLRWARSLRDQCDGVDGAAFFMKQKGVYVTDEGRQVGCVGKGDDVSLFPADLQRQAFPIARVA